MAAPGSRKASVSAPSLIPMWVQQFPSVVPAAWASLGESISFARR